MVEFGILTSEDEFNIIPRTSLLGACNYIIEGKFGFTGSFLAVKDGEGNHRIIKTDYLFGITSTDFLCYYFDKKQLIKFIQVNLNSSGNAMTDIFYDIGQGCDLNYLSYFNDLLQKLIASPVTPEEDEKSANDGGTAYKKLNEFLNTYFIEEENETKKQIMLLFMVIAINHSILHDNLPAYSIPPHVSRFNRVMTPMEALVELPEGECSVLSHTLAPVTLQTPPPEYPWQTRKDING